MTIKAIYRNGVFRPLTSVNLPEGAEVGILLPSEAQQQVQFEKMRRRDAKLSRFFRAVTTRVIPF
jgi:predicted DNA-binding antitoxin AbrB/MazE fold protein